MTQAAPSKNGNRTRPSVAFYRALMVVFERQRLAMGYSMDEVDRIAGTQDGYFAKMLYPDTPTGRQALWPTVDIVAEALFGRDFEIVISGRNEPLVSALTIDKGASTNALKNRHWRHSRHFAELGRLGGLARAKNLSKQQIRAIGKKGAKASKAKRQGIAHKVANVEKRAT